MSLELSVQNALSRTEFAGVFIANKVLVKQVDIDLPRNDSFSREVNVCGCKTLIVIQG